MTVKVEIPDFEFASFYYTDILEALIEYKRRNLPEHTNESEYDPLIQILRSFALVGHLNNVLLDVVANESTLPTAQLPEQVRKMLRLIDYEMATASPSAVDLVLELSKVFLSNFTLVPALSDFSTEKDDGGVEVRFENSDSVEVDRTDQFSSVLSLSSTGSYTDLTAKMNDQTSGQHVTVWTSPALKDSLIFGHESVMWDQLDIAIKNAASGIEGVWEYYDGNFSKRAPDNVSIPSSGKMRFELNDYLGSSTREGTQIRVKLNESGAYEDVESKWDGSKNYIEIFSYLGQTSPSTDSEDYTIGSDWEQFGSLSDLTSDLQATGKVEFDLPQTTERNWVKKTIEGIEAYWMRYRIVSTSSPTSPVIDYAQLDQGKQFALVTVTQGQTQLDIELGSSDGTANQKFEITKDNYISGSMHVLVDGIEWTEVNDFLSSRSTDKHYRVEVGKNDRATIIFGDGVTGQIPSSGNKNIEADYRWGAEVDGNVGALTIIKDKTGLSYVKSLWNPRQAAGWKAADGSDQTSLESAKIAGPASLRTRGVAVTPDDVERLALEFQTNEDSTPFSRAKAFEEGYGAKTVELVVVGNGGVQVEGSILSDAQTWFNGDLLSYPTREKRMVANQEVRVVNFTQKTISVTATIYGNVDAEAIKTRLIQVFHPEAKKSDGVNWLWKFGEDIPTARFVHEIFATSDLIEDVDLTFPASDVVLTSRQLPMLGIVHIIVVK